MRTEDRWFGKLLDWRWDPAQEMHGAWHNGRTHWIAKVSRRTADAQGGGMHPGWTICDFSLDPGQRRWDGWGPGLGRRIGWAKLMAEAWIVCPYSDMMRYPQLRNALVSGVGFMEDGRSLLTVDHDQHRFIASGPRDSGIGYLEPAFTGAGGVVTVAWRVVDIHDRQIAEMNTWQDAVEELKQSLVVA